MKDDEVKRLLDLELFYSCFVNALGVTREELAMDKSLLNDLGADSLDLLDLIYQLENAFNVIIPRGEIEKRARERLAGQEFEVDGYITAAGMESLQAEFPGIDLRLYGEKSLRVSDIPQLFTVKTFYDILENQIQQGNTRLDT